MKIHCDETSATKDGVFEFNKEDNRITKVNPIQGMSQNIPILIEKFVLPSRDFEKRLETREAVHRATASATSLVYLLWWS